MPAETDHTTSIERARALRDALRATIVGQHQVIDELLCALLSEGHVLLEGLPGLGKTELAKCVAACLGLPLSRIQCTPDLLPADVTGGESPGADQRMAWRPGPLIAPFVLVDEINRATPRTQSAFLEAMQERQVTYLGEQHLLPSPFFLIATQNPIELEGTYPLPEAQLDRFAMKIFVPFPDRAALARIADLRGDVTPVSILRKTELDMLLHESTRIIVADVLRDAAVSLIISLQPNAENALAVTREHVRYGPGPRALQSLLRCARAAALLDGRPHVAMVDLRKVALPVLRHRLLLRFESEADGTRTDAVLQDAINAELA